MMTGCQCYRCWMMRTVLTEWDRGGEKKNRPKKPKTTTPKKPNPQNPLHVTSLFRLHMRTESTHVVRCCQPIAVQGLMCTSGPITGAGVWASLLIAQWPHDHRATHLPQPSVWEVVPPLGRVLPACWCLPEAEVHLPEVSLPHGSVVIMLRRLCLPGG